MDRKRPLRWLRALAYEAAGVHARALRRLDGGGAAVLMYHRVIPSEQARRCWIEPGMYVTPETFERHLRWLKSDLNILPLAEIVEALASNRPLPERACAITFDDGWRDNHDHALPALAAYDLPATVFVVTSRVGTSGAFWPDEVSRRLAAAGSRTGHELGTRLGAPRTLDPREGVLERLKALPQAELEIALALLREATPDVETRERELLTWEELSVLEHAGISVESHAATHAILTSLPREAALRELTESRSALLARGLGRQGLLAYPSGGNSRAIRELAAEAGYRAAFTTEPALAMQGSDPLALPRLGVHEDVSRSRVEFRYALFSSGIQPSS